MHKVGQLLKIVCATNSLMYGSGGNYSIRTISTFDVCAHSKKIANAAGIRVLLTFTIMKILQSASDLVGLPVQGLCHGFGY